jgi:hypothetical protein
MKVILAIIMLLTLFVTNVNADIISVNSGGDNQVVITPGGAIESFFTGLTSQSAGGGGGGGGGRAEVPGFSITVIPQQSSVVQDNALPIKIIFNNDIGEEHDVTLHYYVEQVVFQPGWTETMRFGEITESASVLPLGNYELERIIQVPNNATLGNWSIVVEYISKNRQLSTFAGITVVKSIWPSVQYFLIFVVLFTILTWYLLIYRRRNKDDGFIIGGRDEDDDEKNR